MTGPVFDAEFLAQLEQLFIWRRDVRRFRTDPLPAGLMDELLDVACHSPSVGNAQPWRFVRIATPERRAALVAHADAQKTAAAQIYGGDQRAIYDGLKLHGLREAPEIIAAFCDENGTAGHGLGRQTMPETLRYSVVAAIHTLWLAARAHGVGLGWVSLLEPAAMNALLDVPKDWTLVGLLCLGYPTDESDTPELVLHRWQDRLPASETRFTR